VLYWILGGVGVLLSGLVAAFFRRKSSPLVQPAQGVSSEAAQDQKKDVTDKAGQARSQIIHQVSEDLKKIRDKFGMDK